MCVRWLATVRSARKSAAATSRFVRPSATSAATRRSAAVSPSSRCRPPTLPELGPRPAHPAGRAERLEAVERRLDRVAGAALLPRRRRTTPSASSARAPPNGSPTASCSATARSRSAAAFDVPRAAATSPRHASRARAPMRGRTLGVRLPGVEEARPHLDPAELEQELDVVVGPPADARLAPVERRRLPVGPVEPPDGRVDVAAPERGEPEDRQVLRRWSAELLSASSSARSECSRASSSPPRWTATRAIGRWSCGTSSPYWMEISCARRRARPRAPSARPELDPRERPRAPGRSAARRARATPSSRSSSVRAVSRMRRERVHDGQRRLLHELLAADRGREVGARARRAPAPQRRRPIQPRIAEQLRARRSRRRRARRRARAPRARARRAT